MENKKQLKAKIFCFGIILLIFFLSSCVKKPADLRLIRPFMIGAVEGGYMIHFSVVNVGQGTARNAYIIFEFWDPDEECTLLELKIYLGNIKPGEEIYRESKFTGIKWKPSLEIKESFVWD